MTNDGTCTFIIDDVRDGTPVGGIIWSMCDRAGYIRLDGTKFTQTQYPRLWKWVTDNTLNTSNGLFTYNNRAGTMTTPNLVGRFVEGGSIAGKLVEAGLPNIVGGWTQTYPEKWYLGRAWSSWNNFGTWAGALKVDKIGTTPSAGGNITSEGWVDSSLSFDASKSNSIYGASTTVQPPAVQYLPLIRY